MDVEIDCAACVTPQWFIYIQIDGQCGPLEVLCFRKELTSLDNGGCPHYRHNLLFLHDHVWQQVGWDTVWHHTVSVHPPCLTVGQGLLLVFSKHKQIRWKCLCLGLFYFEYSVYLFYFENQMTFFYCCDQFLCLQHPVHCLKACCNQWFWSRWQLESESVPQNSG